MNSTRARVGNAVGTQHKACVLLLRTLLPVVAAVLLSEQLTAQSGPKDAPQLPERLIDMHVHAWQAPPRDEHFWRLLQRAFVAFHVERAVVSGPSAAAVAAAEHVPRIILAGAADGGGVALPQPGEFAAMVQNRRMAILGELDGAWDGLPLTAARLEPYLSIAEERETPVGVFSGVAPPGTTNRFSNYRVELGRPLAIEPLLARHSRLRIYLMQAGWPFLDETI